MARCAGRGDEQLCARYERALIANDVDALEGLFWPSALALRFGVTEELYGAEDIAAFRKAADGQLRRPQEPARDDRHLRTRPRSRYVEFTVTVFGNRRHGRQSQVWVRFGDSAGEIVSAHVSHQVVASPGKEAAFGAAAAALVALTLEPAHRARRGRDLEVMAQVAEPLMAFELPRNRAGPAFTA